MKESDKKAICELAGVEYMDTCRNCEYDNDCSDKYIYGEKINCPYARGTTLEILTKAMVNYNLSKGEYTIMIDCVNGYDSIYVYKRSRLSWVKECGYTSLETYTESLKKALTFVLGGEG